MKIRTSLPVLLTSFALTAQSGIVLQEDYEDDTIGAPPAIGGSNVGDSYGTILNTLSVGTNPSASGNSSAQVLAGAGAATLANNVPLLFAGGAAPIDGLTIQYDFFSSAGAHDNDGVRVALIGDLDSSRDSFIRNDRDKALMIDGLTLADQNYGANVWQRFIGAFTSGADADSYNLFWSVTDLTTGLSVHGNQTVTIAGANFTDGMARGLLLEIFEGNAGANSYSGYLDNLLVTAVPEPSGVALTGLGLTALLFRRRS